MNTHSTRRHFLKHTVAAGALATLSLSGRRVLGANDRIRVAVAGINGRGLGHIRGFAAMPGVEVAYLADPDSRLFDSRGKIVEDIAGARPRCVQDFRDVLDDNNVDAVSIVSTNHWHALQGIWACQAGKDVYVEKPCSHNIVEGRRLVEAARKYDRIVQHGTQRRSDPQWIQLVNDVRGGKYGKLLVSYTPIHHQRLSIGFKEPQEPPKGLDYDLWTGPAPVTPFRTNLVHYRWHWMWDFGNGEIGNMGSHQVDVCRWAMPDGAAPRSVISVGGRFGYKDQGETPNTLLTLIDFGEVKAMVDVRGVIDKKEEKITNEFYTDEGVVRDGMFFPKGKREGIPIADFPAPGPPEQGPRHMHQFIDCVRSRRRDALTAEILEGHRSVLMVHLGNLSYRLGKEVPFDTQTKRIGGDRMFHDTFEEVKSHLAKVGHLELTGSTYRLGRMLAFDAEAERFVDCPEADAMRSRQYRSPFVVPKEV